VESLFANFAMKRLATTAKRIYRAVLPEKVRAKVHEARARAQRLRWDFVKHTGGQLLKEIEPGVKMKLYGDSVLCEMLLFQNFEEETRAFLKAFLRPGDIFFDVGANVGFFTLIAARHVGALGKVHAFEPVRKTHARLIENVRLNGLTNVAGHCVAFSDTIGQATITVAGEGFDAWNSLGKPYMGGVVGTEVVATTTLDEFVERHSLMGRISAIKIDVEGWENRVLIGANRTLSGHDAPLLIVEFTERAARLAGSSCNELHRALNALGYEIMTFDQQTAALTLLPVADQYSDTNVIASKRRSELAVRLGQDWIVPIPPSHLAMGLPEEGMN
jgi:FkbM family methyltransferase